MPSLDPISMNVKGVTDLVRSGLNKVPGRRLDSGEGVSDEYEDDLTLKLSDEKLLALAMSAETKYLPYEGKLTPRQNANKAYYTGRQTEGSAVATDVPIASNLIFEAEETFLPSALSKNPEPVVWSDNTTEGTKQSGDLKTMLQYHSKTLVLRRKMNRLTRQWTMDLLGVMKHGWDPVINDIMTETRDVRNFIFDPDGYIDEYGDYRGGILGEKITVTAQKLADMFPKHAAYITVMATGKMGTKVTYTEWWNDDYTFCTFKNKILDKSKNPNFNYSRKTSEVDEDGVASEVDEEGHNHFAAPKMPYTFLSVFSLGRQPHDETGLIEQNIQNQNRITARDIQIDVNLARSNNSIGLSGANFNEETGKQAAVALQKGNPVLIPAGGPVSDAIARFPAPSIPDAVFRAQENSKNDLRSIFGTQGITSQTPNEDQTARGMILNQQMDSSRIGGGIGDALEQVAENTFNHWVQLYFVFYDEPHFAMVLGQSRAVEYAAFMGQNLTRKFVVTCSPNSMKPEDEVTEMNQTMALWDKQAMDPKTLFTMLDFPDPQKTAEQVVLWKVDPQAYMQLNFPELAKKLQAFQQQQVAAAGGALAAGAAGGAAPEVANGEPAPDINQDPASAALSQVQLPPIPA